MTSHLYVCLFSTGHVKVGRSIDPLARIAAHIDRVKVVGAELLSHRIFEVSGDAVLSEAALISRVDAFCSRKLGNEWFEGVSFEFACEVAAEEASKNRQAPITPLMLSIDKAIEQLGGRSRAAKSLGVTPQCLSGWRSGLRRISVEASVLIEAKTCGAVRVEALRPDVDWAVLREQAAE